MKVNDVTLDDMQRSGDLAVILKKGRYDLTLGEVVSFNKALDWLQKLGLDMVEDYKKEAQADIAKDQAQATPNAGFVIKEWNPTGSHSVVKKKK